MKDVVRAWVAQVDEAALRTTRDAIYVKMVGKVDRKGEEPTLETLVRMKLNSFRDKDRVHLRDMISLGLVDESWLTRYQDRLQDRLRFLLDDPDG